MAVPVQFAPTIPFQMDHPLELEAGTTSSVVTVFTVPDDQRLIIEYVSAFVRVGEEEKVVVSFGVHGGIGNLGQVHVHVPVFFQGKFLPNDIYAAAQAVRLYADPGSSVEVSLARSFSPGGADARFQLCGYLVGTEQ